MRLLILPVAALVAAASPAAAQDSTAIGRCARPDSVVFRGSTRLTDATLRSSVAVTPGAAINYRVVARAERDLMATTQFDDVRVTCEEGPNGKWVIAFELKERPLLTDVDVHGPSRVSPSSVKEQVDLLVGRPVDPAQVARAIAKIDSLYESEGYYFARVRAETTFVDSGSAKLLFVVDEGHRNAVSGIRIIGNKALSASAIVGAMQTKPEGLFWWHTGEFDTDKYAGDLTERIPALYANHGFIDMQVVKDSMVVDRKLGKSMLELTINEGPQYHVGDFQVVGARKFSSEELAVLYPFTPRSKTLSQAVKGLILPGAGKNANIFDKSAWVEATGRVSDAYSDEGYIYARVNPVEERHRAGPDSVPTVDLRWEINEGAPAIVNRVDIVGNDRTSETCIRRQLILLPGAVFNKSALFQSYQNVANLGFFDTPLPQPGVEPGANGDVDITFHVKEKHTGNVNFGASVGQGTGVGGFVGFDEPNLLGLCKRGSVQWNYGKYINDFNMTYTDPAIRESQLSGSLSGSHSRSRFVIQNIGQSTTTGAQLQLGFPVLGSRWTRFLVSYGAEAVKYGSGGLVGTIQPCTNSAGTASSCFRSSVGLTLDRDTRFDQPFPSVGTHQSINAQLNGGVLGGSASYQRYTGEMRTYATLAGIGGGGLGGGAPIKLVTGLKVRWGALFGDPGPFFVSQAFSMGGVQYGEPLRGYDEFSITPLGFTPNSSQFQAQRTSFGNAFLGTTAELGLRFSQQLYIDAFYDAGNLWSRPQDFDPSRLFRGVGFGGAIVTPLGPLGVDFGYGLDRVDALGRKDPKWQVHFKFGQIF